VSAVVYRTTGVKEIDCIHPLWEDLNRYPGENTPHFRRHYERMTFEDRKEYFTKLDLTGLLHIDLALDTVTCKDVGYCLCSVSLEKSGSIESIFVHPSHRSKGIGTTLVNRGQVWMDSCGVLQKRVSVAAGNENALSFYGKFRFVPRMMVLEQISEQEERNSFQNLNSDTNP
jgi:ribosomal protein S18 acetylase RimI-like enzyme